ncbi:hypothetical protein RFI_27407, partial [Reticulomyxa filosa]
MHRTCRQTQQQQQKFLLEYAQTKFFSLPSLPILLMQQKALSWKEHKSSIIATFVSPTSPVLTDPLECADKLKDYWKILVGFEKSLLGLSSTDKDDIDTWLDQVLLTSLDQILQSITGQQQQQQKQMRNDPNNAKEEDEEKDKEERPMGAMKDVSSSVVNDDVVSRHSRKYSGGMSISYLHQQYKVWDFRKRALKSYVKLMHIYRTYEWTPRNPTKSDERWVKMGCYVTFKDWISFWENHFVVVSPSTKWKERRASHDKVDEKSHVDANDKEGDRNQPIATFLFEVLFLSHERKLVALQSIPSKVMAELQLSNRFQTMFLELFLSWFVMIPAHLWNGPHAYPWSDQLLSPKVLDQW